MHHSINPQEIKTESEKLGHMITNIWNIKQYRTKLPLFMFFFLELKPASNNKGILNVDISVQNKIWTTQTQKEYCSVQTVKDMGTTRYGHPKPRCVKCTEKNLTNKCHRKERSSDIRCVLCGGNHPANYKGCQSTRTYKRKHTYLSIWNSTLLHICTNQTNLTHSTMSNTCSNNWTKFLCCHKYRARSTHKPTSSANQQYTGLRYDEKPFWANGNCAKPLHNRAY
jgi:hypothetical protein